MESNPERANSPDVTAAKRALRRALADLEALEELPDAGRADLARTILTDAQHHIREAGTEISLALCALSGR